MVKIIKDGGDIMEEYIKIFYEGNVPDNVSVFLLPEKEYILKYKQLMKSIYGKTDGEYRWTAGYTIKNPKDKKYYVLVKDKADEEINTLTLFHELAHTETFLKTEFKERKKYPHFLDGYLFWQEYIAQWIAVKKYREIKEISYLSSSELIKEKILYLKKYLQIFLYEIVVYTETLGLDSDIDGVDILIAGLKIIKEKYPDLRKIEPKDLNILGEIVYKVYQEHPRL